MKRKFFTCFACFVSAFAVAATNPLWMRDVKISPDGEKIAFTYYDDIWTVPVHGGEATRLTSTEDTYEDHPIWSPDSKKIAFSSNRYGNFDIYIVGVEGGTPKRLTFHSANEYPEAFTHKGDSILFSAALQDQTSSVLFPTGRLTELYAISVDGGAPKQVAGIPVQMPTYSSKNPHLVYFQDLKGMEDEWRKHHTSSVTRDLWMWNRATDEFTNLTNRPGEDRNPVISPDGSTLYFLREEPGKTLNVYSMSPSNPESATQLTGFDTHPVRFLSIADNGMLAFTYDGEIYTMRQGHQPEKVDINVTVDFTPITERLNLRDIVEAVPSPDGKSVAFISRGDVFVTSVDYATTKQITNTPQAESNIGWSPDGSTLIYVTERNGIWEIYTAKKGRADDPNFENATLIVEEPLFAQNHDIERTYPTYSPDWKKLAYIEDRSKLMVKDLDSGKTSMLLDGSTHRSRNGGYNYQWSPDSKWIVAEGILHKHDPYSDIFLVNVGDATLIPLTETGYFDESPRFALDGEAVIYLSDRYGMRNHASWGSLQDVMIVFLNEDAYDRFNLSKEDYELKKELEKTNAGKKDEKDKKGKPDKDENSKEIIVEPRNIQDRTIRLTTSSADIADAIIPNDNDNLYYLASFNDGYDLWKVALRERKTEEAKKLGARRSAFVDDLTGKHILLASANSIKKFEPSGEKLTTVSYGGKHNLNRTAEREYMFDYVKRQEREMFYDTAMHGVDWETLTEHYRKFLPHINNNYDFAEMLSELLGELNVSHTGGRYYAPSNPNDERTASLGLLFDMTDFSKGLVVTEVIEGGPMDKAWSKIAPGDVITSINNVTIDNDTNFWQLLADLAGKKTLVNYVKPSGENIDETVVPVSIGTESNLLYKRWIKNRAADVERWSNGRLGYVHIQSMADPSFRDIYADILGKYNEKEGIVIDIRWNGGGRLHEDIEVLFSGEKYFTQVIRGEETCDMPSRRWNKPSIMVQAEACYSNAHGTPWVYKHKGLGKLVGAPVPGTMTSVNWVTMQDPTMVFGIPVIGYRLPDGSYLENTQLEPDVYVLNSPIDAVGGHDVQLHTAVKELLKQIDGK